MTTKLGIILTLLSIYTVIPNKILLASAPLPVMVYKKTLPKGGNICVYKKRLPADPDTIKSLSAWKSKAPANVHIDLPDYSEAYTYKWEREGLPPKILWFERMDRFTGQDLNEIKVLDVAYESEQLVVVLKFKEPPIIYAAVVDTRKKSQDLSTQNNLLVAASDAYNIYPKSATITGSLAKDTLSVDVTLLGGKHQIFQWKDSKWQKVPEAAPAPAPSQNGAADAPPPPP